MRFTRVVAVAMLFVLYRTSAGSAQELGAGSAKTGEHLPEAQSSLNAALLGTWVGLLTYRDYSEAAESTKRVQLPTWLAIEQRAEGLKLHYTYDDGPGKIVEDRSTLIIDVAKKSYRLVGTDAVVDEYQVDGLDKLRDGFGVLTLSGPGKENNVAVEVRETLTIRRNLVSWLRETRPPKSSGEFSFRHQYTFVRAAVPVAAVRGQ